MYKITFSDGIKYEFTEEQIIKIPYFDALINSSFKESNNKEINISSSSIGFEYVHIFATMDEIDIIDPGEKYNFAIKQCDYFQYDKLKTLLENKYGYRTDINNIKYIIGTEITIKMKYICKFLVKTYDYPITQHNPHCSGYLTRNSYEWSKDICKYYDKIKINCTYYNDHHVDVYDIGFRDGTYFNNPIKTEYQIGCLLKYKIYAIIPIYDYPNYTTDDEINEIYKKRYRKRHNSYFFKIIQKILIFGDSIICAKNNDKVHNLLKEMKENDYENIDWIITDKPIRYNENFYVKYIDNHATIYGL